MLHYRKDVKAVSKYGAGSYFGVRCCSFTESNRFMFELTVDSKYWVVSARQALLSSCAGLRHTAPACPEARAQDEAERITGAQCN